MIGHAHRLDPQMPVHAYTTYQLLRPKTTHYRAATCREVECEAYANGWRSVIDISTPLGARQANYVRLKSGRHFSSSVAGTVITFTFPPGQQCFAEHRVPLGREPLYIVRGGDWRGNPRGERRVHTRPDLWVEDFATHQDKLSTEIGRG